MWIPAKSSRRVQHKKFTADISFVGWLLVQQLPLRTPNSKCGEVEGGSVECMLLRWMAPLQDRVPAQN